jgi:hypothetical protein
MEKMTPKRKLREIPRRKDRWPEVGVDHPPGACDRCDSYRLLEAAVRRSAERSKGSATIKDFDPRYLGRR